MYAWNISHCRGCPAVVETDFMEDTPQLWSFNNSTTGKVIIIYWKVIMIYWQVTSSGVWPSKFSSKIQRIWGISVGIGILLLHMPTPEKSKKSESMQLRNTYQWLSMQIYAVVGALFLFWGVAQNSRLPAQLFLTPPPSQAAVAQTDRRHRSRTEMAQKWGEWQKMNGSFHLFSFAESTLSIITLNQFPTFQFCFLPFFLFKSCTLQLWQRVAFESWL